MTTTSLTSPLLEMAALNNGFDRELPPQDGWRVFASTGVQLRVWIRPEPGESAVGFHVGLGQANVARQLDGHGHAVDAPSVAGAVAVRQVPDYASLHLLLRRAVALSRSLPSRPLDAFREKTRDLPRTTEAERLVVQRVGQDLFREALLDYWDGRCCVTGLAVPELLRASHIKPWADATDEERLDVFNGLLLAPHLDAAFDKGFVTVGDDGGVIVSDALGERDRSALAIAPGLMARGLGGAHGAYLRWHRDRVFRGGAR